jgi:hypothetical protein
MDSNTPPTIGAITRRLQTRYRVPPVGEAVERLEAWRERIVLLQLYQIFFPEQFAHSHQSVAPGLDNATGYADREREFFALVNMHLFPVALPEDYLPRGERFSEIPVLTQAVEWFSDEEFSQLPRPVQVFVALVGGMDAMDWNTIVPSAPAILNGVRDMQHFRRLCRRAGGVFTDAPLGLDMLSYSTGNLFLDSTSEMETPSVAWDADAVHFLTAEWRAAKKLLDRFNRLVDRFEQNPGALVRMTELWNRALEKTKGTDEPHNPDNR